MAYSKEVVERFEGVLNSPEQFSVGRFDPKDPTVATGLTGAPACGDVMKLQLKLNPWYPQAQRVSREYQVYYFFSRRIIGNPSNNSGYSYRNCFLRNFIENLSGCAF